MFVRSLWWVLPWPVLRNTTRLMCKSDGTKLEDPEISFFIDAHRTHETAAISQGSRLLGSVA